MTSVIALTSIVETTVYGVKAYHVRCSCGWCTKPVDRESTALRWAKEHARKIHSDG